MNLVKNLNFFSKNNLHISRSSLSQLQKSLTLCSYKTYCMRSGDMSLSSAWFLGIRKKSYSTDSTTNNDALHMINERIKENKARNILIYSYDEGQGLVINIFGILGAFVILYMSYTSFVLFGSVKNVKKKDIESGEETLFEKALNTISKDAFRYIVCITVASIGGNKIGLVTQGYFGMEKTLTVKLDDASFNKRLENQTANIPLKIRKKPFHYLISADGVFHEKALFNYVICLKREI